MEELGLGAVEDWQQRGKKAGCPSPPIQAVSRAKVPPAVTCSPNAALGAEDKRLAEGGSDWDTRGLGGHGDDTLLGYPPPYG